jgi:hypothetical protein
MIIDKLNWNIYYVYDSLSNVHANRLLIT